MNPANLSIDPLVSHSVSYRGQLPISKYFSPSVNQIANQSVNHLF